MVTSYELKEVKGVGEVTAERLAERGIDSLGKLADASEKDLAGIEGLPAKRIPGIIKQARILAAKEQRNEESLAELVGDANHLRDQVETLVLNIRDRFAGEDAQQPTPKALRKEIYRTLGSLEKIEAVLSEQMRRLSNKLAKADARLTGLADSDPDKVAAGLKKARKKIEKAVE